MSKEIRYLIIPNKKNIEFYTNKGINAFILPLKEYSVGFDVYFDIEEIKEISKKNEVYIIVNKFLHSEVDSIKEILKDVTNKVFIEDFGLASFLGERAILSPNHIISNYESINFLSSLGFNNLVINNELTITEINTIKENTLSNLFYFYINKNMIMYSRRKLVSTYFENFGIKSNKKTNKIIEKVTGKELIIKEENDSSVVFYKDTFVASKYLSSLQFMTLIVNLNLVNSSDEIIILDNLKNENLHNLIESDYGFLENEIKYKVGDL